MTIIDQKVREKLANFKLPEDKYASAYPTLGYKWADALLQSPDLRVTLVEPRFRIEHKPTLNEYWLMETQSYPIQGNVVIIAKLEDGMWAEKVLAWLDSKEPKS